MENWHPGVDLGHGQFGYGLFLKQPVAAGTLLIRSPALLAGRAATADAHAEAMLLCDAITMGQLANCESPYFYPYLMSALRLLEPRNTSTREGILHKLLLHQNGGIGSYSVSLHGTSSLLNHSCTPNCHTDTDDVLLERCYTALHSLQPTELFISYIPYPIDDAEARRRFISRLDFDCECACCASGEYPSQRDYQHATLHCWQCGAGPCELRCCYATYCSQACREKNAPIHKVICKKQR